MSFPEIGLCFMYRSFLFWMSFPDFGFMSCSKILKSAIGWVFQFQICADVRSGPTRGSWIPDQKLWKLLWRINSRIFSVGSSILVVILKIKIVLFNYRNSIYHVTTDHMTFEIMWSLVIWVIIHDSQIYNEYSRTKSESKCMPNI